MEAEEVKQIEDILEKAETIEKTTKHNKGIKAKSASLFAQIVGALWIALWCSKNFIDGKGSTNDVIFSGFAISACFCPVYFNLIMDKIKNIKFGD